MKSVKLYSFSDCFEIRCLNAEQIDMFGSLRLAVKTESDGIFDVSKKLEKKPNSISLQITRKYCKYNRIGLF